MGLHSCTERTQADCPPCKAGQDQGETLKQLLCNGEGVIYRTSEQKKMQI